MWVVIHYVRLARCCSTSSLNISPFIFFSLYFPTQDDTQENETQEIKQHNKAIREREEHEVAAIKSHSFKKQLAFYITRIDMHSSYTTAMQTKAYTWLMNIFAKGMCDSVLCYFCRTILLLLCQQPFD